MTINWHVINEIAQWLVLARIWLAIVGNNQKILDRFSKINRQITPSRKW